MFTRDGLRSLLRYMYKCLMHYHYYTMAHDMKHGRAYNSF
jgi:hypothetical protein